MAKKSEKQKDEERSEPVVGKQDKTPVFSIPTGDPYVDGVVRHIGNTKEKSRIDVNARPLVIPADDAAALSALQNYVRRAAGSGDSKRADIAKKAIETFETFAGK